MYSAQDVASCRRLYVIIEFRIENSDGPHIVPRHLRKVLMSYSRGSAPEATNLNPYPTVEVCLPSELIRDSETELPDYLKGKPL